MLASYFGWNDRHLKMFLLPKRQDVQSCYQVVGGKHDNDNPPQEFFKKIC